MREKVIVPLPKYILLLTNFFFFQNQNLLLGFRFRKKWRQMREKVMVSLPLYYKPLTEKEEQEKSKFIFFGSDAEKSGGRRRRE